MSETEPAASPPAAPAPQAPAQASRAPRLALIAVVLVSALTLLGSKLNTTFGKIESALP